MQPKSTGKPNFERFRVKLAEIINIKLFRHSVTAKMKTLKQTKPTTFHHK